MFIMFIIVHLKMTLFVHCLFIVRCSLSTLVCPLLFSCLPHDVICCCFFLGPPFFGAPLVYSISLVRLAHGAPLTTLCMCLGSLVNTAAMFSLFCLLYSDILAVSGLTHSLSFLGRRCPFNDSSAGDAPPQQSMVISRPLYPWLCQDRRRTGSHDARGGMHGLDRAQKRKKKTIASARFMVSEN